MVFSGHTKNLQFTEERPPWETLDGYTEALLDESSNPQPSTRDPLSNYEHLPGPGLRLEAPTSR